jgi:2-hydroxy-3-oxopropionate reductase
MLNIGLIGIGNIGQFYTKQLLNAGYPLLALDIDPEKLAFAVNLGAKPAADARQIFQESDIIILALPGSHVVEPLLDDVLDVMRAGQLVIDTSTCRPSTAIKYEKICARYGVGLIDSPLTWRSRGQILMVGGSQENFAKAEEILKCLSYKYKYIGAAGSGQVLKMINQAIQATQLAAQAEVVELAKKQGLDPTLIRDYLEYSIPDQLFTGDYHGGGHLALHYKDLGYLLEIAHDSGANIPISSLVHEMFKTSKIYGESNWLQIGIQTYYKRLNNDTLDK